MEIRRVSINKATGQRSVSIPKSSELSEDNYVGVVKLEVKVNEENANDQ